MAGTGRSVIRLDIAEPAMLGPLPDAPAPAGRRNIPYSAGTGLAELRAAIADRMAETSGVSVTPDQILCTSGASSALILALAVLTDPGETVLIADPGYPPYAPTIEAVGGRVCRRHVSPAASYQFTAEDLAAVAPQRPRAVILNSPSNPTGAISRREDIQLLVDAGLSIIADETYIGLEYEPADRLSAAGVDPGSTVISSFSKLYGTMGARIGYAVAPLDLVDEFRRMQQHLFIAAPYDSQVLALRILQSRHNGGWPLPDFRARRDMVLSSLLPLGFECPFTPQAGLYLFVDGSRRFGPATAVADAWLAELGVAASPGADFGTASDGALRIALTEPEERLAEAMRRITNWARSRSVTRG